MGVALITGSASGIGAAIAERLSEDYEVVGFDLEDGDLTTRAGNRAAVDAATAAGDLKLVVANAGVQVVSPVADLPEDDWDRLIALMLTSPFLLAKYAWPALKAGDGQFIAIASAHGLVASPNKAAYVAAKHGVLGLVKTLCLEGLTATAVCPAFVRTPLAEKQIEERGEDALLAPHVVKRLIEPSEVAEAVAFLTTPAGRTITGAPLIMDQGWTAR
jgi:3-hydroxybutyrate dehydrogenase